jgi:hypothetical protein
VLAVVVLFFVLWTVALKHTLTGSGSGGSPSQPAYQSALNQARGLQSVVNSAGAKAGGTPSPTASPSTSTTQAHSATPASTPHPAAHKAAHAAQAKPAHHHSPHAKPTSTIASTATGTAPIASVPPAPVSRPTGMALVDQALRQRKVLAVLFYNPAAANDRAVRAELSSIPTHGGRVVKLAVPVQKLGDFSSLLNQVQVNFSPTLVLINRDRQAEEIVGFADSFEIAQRVTAELAAGPHPH